VKRAGRLVAAVLAEYGARTRAALEPYLKRDQSELYAMAADYPGRGGRALRASLCIASARVFGASIDDAINSAVALELLHNAFLVHDDVEDESEERRGHPTLHALHGVPTAVNVGDALTVMSLRPLIANRRALGERVALRILEETEIMARESVEGQAMELGWRRTNLLDLTGEDYLRMILKKTCWYTVIYPCRIGALIGTRDGQNLDRYVRFGFFTGAAFQIQDDLLNLVGDKRRYGKEIGGDLWEGKRTLMLIHVLNHAATDERRRISGLLATPRGDRQSGDIRWLRGLMDRTGAIEYARETAHGLAGAARHEYALAYGDAEPSRDRDFLEALSFWALERS
jgi:geranylgeranyl diphosphate synthase, type II